MMPVREASIEDLDLGEIRSRVTPQAVVHPSSGGERPVGPGIGRALAVPRSRRGPSGSYGGGGATVRQAAPALPAHSAVDFIRFEGEDPSYRIKDCKQINGTVNELVKAAAELIEQLTVRSYEFRGCSPVRVDVVKYALRAVREAVPDAVLQRDSEISRTMVTIKMFDDRLEILSPGNLYGIVTKENFKTESDDYRNPMPAVPGCTGRSERSSHAVGSKWPRSLFTRPAASLQFP